MNAATRAAIAAMTIAMGFAIITALKAEKAVFTALKALTSLGRSVIIVPTELMTLPTTISTGPMAAATSAIVRMTVRIPSSMPFSQSTIF